MNQALTYDSVIVGGGITGFSLALQFHRLGEEQKTRGETPWRILIVDQKPFQNGSAIQKDAQNLSPLRVSTINNSQFSSLINAGLEANPGHLCPVKSMQVSEKNGSSFFTLNSNEIGLKAMAYVMENEALTQSMFNTLQDSPHIDIKFQFQLSHYKSISDDNIELNFIDLTNSDKLTVETKLLIGSDGQHSKVRQLAGIDTQASMDSEIALVANFRTEYAHKNTARQIFLDNSVLAFLPIQHPITAGADAISIVWSGKDTVLNSFSNLPANEFEQQVSLYGNNLNQNIFGKLKLTSDIATIPLTPQIAKRFVKQNIILVGDAAHTLHPLAGQGANLGLADCEVLAQHLSKARQLGVHLGNYSWNRRYERGRKFEASKLTRTIKTVQWAYNGNNAWLMRLFRHFGLEVFNQSSTVHQWTMKKMQRLGAGF